MKLSLTLPFLPTSANSIGSTFNISLESSPLPLWSQPTSAISCQDYCNSLLTDHSTSIFNSPQSCLHIVARLHQIVIQTTLLTTSVPPVPPHLPQEQQIQSSHHGRSGPSYVIWPLVVSPKSLLPLSPLPHRKPLWYLATSPTGLTTLGSPGLCTYYLFFPEALPKDIPMWCSHTSF